MSYSAITTQEVTTGEPTSAAMLLKVKDNLHSHELRLQDLEGGDASSPAPITLSFEGSYGVSYLDSGKGKMAINFDLRITGVRLYIDKCGVSGTTDVDVKFKRGVGAWTSILSTRPSVAFGAGDDAVSSNAVINTSNDDLEAGDLICFDVVTSQIKGKNFFIRLDYERT